VGYSGDVSVATGILLTKESPIGNAANEMRDLSGHIGCCTMGVWWDERGKSCTTDKFCGPIDR
jgi:hypothetical protein